MVRETLKIPFLFIVFIDKRRYEFAFTKVSVSLVAVIPLNKSHEESRRFSDEVTKFATRRAPVNLASPARTSFSIPSLSKKVPVVVLVNVAGP